MKRRKTAWWIASVAALAVGAFFFLSIGLPLIDYRHSRAQILSADPKALLAACREMIARRERFTNTWADLDPSSTQIRTLNSAESESSPDVPAILREMHPLGIDIETNRVIVHLHGAPRVGFIGYSEDAVQTRIANEEIKTIMVTNGLWRF